jgi:D,D-heptose 1,7-bisphosphate phosphatase
VPNKAVFIDRDDTIARDVPYCSRPEDFELLPGAADGIRMLKKAGFKIVLVTNQSGVARGFFTCETLDRIHAKMQSDLALQGTSIDGVYYCPHHPDENCACRKPSPKMILDASHDLDIDIAQSYMVGDRDFDVEMGIRAGCKKSLKINLKGKNNPAKDQFDTFLNAVYRILEYEKN